MRFLSLVAMAAVALSWTARPGLADDAIHLKNRTIDPTLEKSVGSSPASMDGTHALVRMDHKPTAAERRELAREGLHLLTPLGNGAWVARLDHVTDAAARRVRWAGELPAEDKISRGLRDGMLHAHSKLADGRRVLDVQMHPDVTMAQGRAMLEGMGLAILDEAPSIRLFQVAAGERDFGAIAANDAVMWVDETSMQLEENMYQAKPATGADVAKETWGLTGKGVKAFVLDGGVVKLDGNDDWAGRVERFGLPVPDVVGHPHHVVGIIAGDGTNSDGFIEGMAPEVGVISASFIPGFDGLLPPMYYNYGNMDTAYDTAINEYGANVANNSIGSNLAELANDQNGYCEFEGDYNLTAQQIDTIVGGAYGPISIVWSIGNERGYSPGCGTYETIAPPATAKNSIGVGSSNKEDDSVSFFSSWGPTDDGRLRPDVSAPGCSTGRATPAVCGENHDEACPPGIVATGRKNEYISFCGTSMAGPVVTGGVSLLMQRWKDTKGEPLAAHSTFKALVVHGAKKVEEQDGPSYRMGYGVLNIPGSVLAMDDGILVLDEALDQGDVWEQEFTVDGGEVKGTLVWTDKPGPVLTSKSLVNDLDLKIVTKDGDELPWILDPAHPADDATKGENHRDPVEQVQFDGEPRIGETVTVVVTGSDVPDGPQAFSLVLTGLTDGPVGDDDDDDTGDDDTGDDDTGDDDSDDDFGDDDSADDDTGDDDDDDNSGCGS
ncbi:MAG: S8 family serine peptidase [Deltaproteobacteria bacterium]|nr:S8 family serine peptidase [Deltaproteobacteria bacterium]